MGEGEWDPCRISLSHPTTLPGHPVISRNHNEPTSLPSRAPPGSSPSHEPLPPADRSFWPRSVHGLGSALTSMPPFPGPTPCPLHCRLPKSKCPSPLIALKLSVSFPFLGPPKGFPTEISHRLAPEGLRTLEADPDGALANPKHPPPPPADAGQTFTHLRGSLGRRRRSTLSLLSPVVWRGRQPLVLSSLRSLRKHFGSYSSYRSFTNNNKYSGFLATKDSTDTISHSKLGGKVKVGGSRAAEHNKSVPSQTKVPNINTIQNTLTVHKIILND